MKKQLMLTAILVILIVGIPLQLNIKPVSADTITVPGQYPTIQEAINAAAPGDTILVAAGTYFENVSVNKTVSLVGENRETTIIDAKGNATVIRVRADGVVIEGFTLRNSTSYNYEWGDIACINVVGYNHTTVRNNIIRDNNEYGVLFYRSNNNIVTGNNITNNGWGGIYSEGSSNNVISGNVVADNGGEGIEFEYTYPDFIYPVNNTIVENTIMNNSGNGVFFLLSYDNTVSNNRLDSNMGGIYVMGGFNVFSANNITNSGSPGIEIYYSNNSVFTGNIIEGGVEAFSSSDNVISDNDLCYGEYGVEFSSSSNNTLTDNGIYYNDYGIYIETAHNNSISNNWIFDNTWDGINFYDAYNCTIIGNDVSLNNEYGVYLYSSGNNTIIGNNIGGSEEYNIYLVYSSNNTIFYNYFDKGWMADQVYSFESVNGWDSGYPSGGNYWDDHHTYDLFMGPGQNTSGSDAIEDTPYDISDGVERDRYPLMGPPNRFKAGTFDNVTYYVFTVSNSTVEDFYFDAAGAFVRFNVTEENGTAGFCRVAIPKDLLWAVNDDWMVTVGGSLIGNWTIIPDEDFTYLYITYTHSTKTVQITGTDAVPELPSITLLALLIFFLTLAAIYTKRKLPKKTRIRNLTNSDFSFSLKPCMLSFVWFW
jgi:parallel beta-helix repeat protein